MADARVLLVGEDKHLLLSRSAVLERSGIDITACLPHDLKDCAAGEFALVVLCHSLSHRNRVAMISVSRGRWPGATVLQIASMFARKVEPCGEDAVSEAHPAKLTAMVESLLVRKPLL